MEIHRIHRLHKYKSDKTSQIIKFDSQEIFSIAYDVLLSKTHSVTTLHNFRLQCWTHSGDRNDSKSISSHYNRTAFSILIQHHFTILLLHKICLYVDDDVRVANKISSFLTHTHSSSVLNIQKASIMPMHFTHLHDWILILSLLNELFSVYLFFCQRVNTNAFSIDHCV